MAQSSLCGDSNKASPRCRGGLDRGCWRVALWATRPFLGFICNNNNIKRVPREVLLSGLWALMTASYGRGRGVKTLKQSSAT